MNHNTVNIDISDWVSEATRNGIEINSREDIINYALKKGYSTTKIARAAIALRNMGRSPDHLLISNKVLLQSGARSNVNSIIASQKERITTESGKKIEVRSFVGNAELHDPEDLLQEGQEAGGDAEDNETQESKTGYTKSLSPTQKRELRKLYNEGNDSEAAYVRVTTSQAVVRAKKYLFNNTPGHIRKRLDVLIANGEPVEPVVEKLKRILDDMVEEE